METRQIEMIYIYMTAVSFLKPGHVSYFNRSMQLFLIVKLLVIKSL